MATASVTVTVVLAALLSVAAIRKLSHRQAVVQSYARVGVPDDKLDHLAGLLLAGAAGLLLGLVWAPVGLAAAIGVLCYFVIAAAFHIRARDTRRLATPLTYAAIAAADLALRLGTL